MYTVKNIVKSEAIFAVFFILDELRSYHQGSNILPCFQANKLAHMFHG